MKNAILLSLILALSSCSFHLDPTIEYRYDPEFEAIMSSFYKEAEARGIIIEKINLNVALDNSNRVVDAFSPGVSRREGIQRVIVIDNYTFSVQDEWQNEVMVFHELGHSLLERKHIDSYQSIMNTIPKLHMYRNDSTKREEMLNEFFSAVIKPHK